jgi:hypothetical protein
MIGSVLVNEFPLILLIIGNVPRLRDGIRTLSTDLISKSRAMKELCYMGLFLNALLLSQSPLLEFYVLDRRGC